MAFEEHLWALTLEALTSLAVEERSDTYVVSLYVYDEDDDPRLPTLTIGTNTESQFRTAIDPPPDLQQPNPWWTPEDEAEARWNFAF